MVFYDFLQGGFEYKYICLPFYEVKQTILIWVHP